jgi:hypothetical protein
MFFYRLSKQVIYVSLAFLFLGCEDKSYFKQVYDQKLFDQKTTCLQLKLTPYSDEIYQKVKNFYPFEKNCTRTLEIKYKTKIGCNSPYNTNKNFNSFIEFDLLEENKLFYTLYKDLKSDDDINEELQKGYEQLWKRINH